MPRMSRTTLALLLTLPAACGPRAECEGNPALCTWQLSSDAAITKGEAYKLTIAVNGQLLSVGVSRTMAPIVIKGGDKSSPPIELAWLPGSECAKVSTNFESLYCFGATIEATQIPEFAPGPIRIVIQDGLSESSRFTVQGSSKQSLELTYKNPLNIPSSPITYVDADPETPTGYPFPIRLVPGTWKNPMSPQPDPVFFSLHRGLKNGSQKRLIKVLKFIPGPTPQLTLNPEQGIYATPNVLD